jgi:Zn-dependent metalloprotease
MHRRILLLILIIISGSDMVAQQNPGVTPNAISTSTTATGKFFYAHRDEPPRAIEFKENTVTASYFLAHINQYFNIPTEFTFVETESNTDKLGMQHRLLQQYYQGIPLEGMGYRVHEKDGFVRSSNGKAVGNIKLDTQVILNEQQAFDRAVNHLQTQDTVFREGRKLIVSKDFTFTPQSFFIAFQFDIDVSLVERWRISIDARSGEVINKISLVNSCLNETASPIPYATGTGSTSYYGNKTIQIEKMGTGSRLVGQTEHGGSIGTYDFQNVSVLSIILFFQFSKAYDFYSSDNTYNSPYLKPAVSAQWAAEQAYEYYFRKHGRNSFDNNGGAIKSYVHVDQNMNNAFWTGKILAFGDGSNNNPLVELDVVSHELTHGVTQYEAQLQYNNEPGALNESFSDILGKAVEFDVFGDTATWQIGRHNTEGGLRDFSNPNLKNQADTYAGDLWYTGYEDNGGVHYNSGVQNFWFYLLCEGGSGVNDHQVNYSVNAIGMDAAVDITYRNLTEYLTPLSDYLDSRIGSMLATADLYGQNSTVYQEVDKAWDAVGVIDEPIITSLELYDITATTVKIKGNLLPRSSFATYHFEYGITPDYGSSSLSYQYADKVEGIATGLQSETKYYFRLVATNENGDSYAAAEFTTISLAPLVKITQTVDVTETTATLYGQINPNSLFTSFYFEYGLTPDFGLVTPSYPVSDGTEFQDVSAAIVDLLARQTYYYRLVATNDFSSTASESASFFTAVKPVISSFAPVSAAIGTVITITGQNFNSISENNLVSFGATRGAVLSSTSTEIKVKVPAGSSFGPISLLDAESGLTAESIVEFVPAFTGEFKKGSLQLTVGLSDINIYKAVVQDMDGDNKPDIIGSHYQGFSVFQNVNQGGDVTIESFIRSTFPMADFNSAELFVVDFDGNGLKDVVVRYQNGLRIYPNFSVPGYIFFGIPVDLPMEYLRELAFNDFDMDGHIDIAGIAYLPGENSMLTIIRNQNPRGSLSADNFKNAPIKNLTYYTDFLTTGDLNNDGTPDLMLGSDSKSFLSILTNNSQAGIFQFEENIVQDVSRGRFVRYVAHDLNQDSWKDIISNSPYVEGNVALMENKGISTTIALQKPVITLSDAMESTTQAGDMNGDGKVDFLAGLGNRTFIFFENKTGNAEHLSTSSFEKSEAYGMALVNSGSGTVDTQMTINDLNGDGRPEVINTYSYNFGPHDGYEMEIWQNGPVSCPVDPSQITLESSNYYVTIKLPPNSTIDQFQIEYTPSGGTFWYGVNDTTFYVSSGYSYQLRVRAKCYLGFTDYYYLDFSVDCVDTKSFSISNVGINTVSISASNLGSFEVQYSPTGKDQWVIVSQQATQISNLLPGTTYDLRFRGRCNALPEFKHRQFTTLCPELSTLTIANLEYNKAIVNWTSSYPTSASLAYSTDSVNWTAIDETRTMYPLSPVTQYFVSGALACTNINSDSIYTSFTTPCPKVSLIDFDNITPYSARVSWVDDSKTNSYILTYSATSDGTETRVETSSTFFNLKGLNPGTQYKVAVAPQCVAIKDFTSATFNTVCYVPFNLSVNAVTHTTAELSWDDNFHTMPYAVDYSISGSNVWLTTETSLRNISLTELRPGTEYEVRIHINCTSETAPYVSMFLETSLYNETTLAPNPTDNKITIYPSKALIGNRFSIQDNTGRQVTNAKLLDYTIDLSILSPGIYTLTIEGEKPMKIMKR